tara:strand:+ start:496 stop:987 length:492 start_codon:yes stop_codon:yes gene_type:complete
MLFLKYLNPFLIYNFILLITFSLSVNNLESLSIISSFTYVFFHYLIVYLAIYYFRNTLYLIYFFYGLALDLLLINQIGPHLFIFMFLLIIFNRVKKYFYKSSAISLFILIISIQIFILSLEMFITHLFFGYLFEAYYLFKIIFISLIISYPILLLFSFIDKLK